MKFENISYAFAIISLIIFMAVSSINIKGNTYGLHQTLIGNVNRLNKINIIKDE